MTAVPRKMVFDEGGRPVEVIVPWEAFCEIAETFGWDLDEQTKENLRQSRADFEAGKKEAFIPLDEL